MADVLNTLLDIDAVRRRFSSLQDGFAFLDAPGGSQVPDEVGDAIARALREASANLGAGYATSLRVKEILEGAEARAARFLGCDTEEIIFGPNMTSLDFTLSRTAGREFAPGDEIIVSSLDHDGGVAPWLELAHDRELVVKQVELRDDTTFDYDDLRSKLSERTRVVAFAWASNAVGTIVDARRVCELAHSVGALAWIDAVHYAAHEPIDVRAVDADVLICSPYKFCGPHMGIAYGRASVIERWRPYKARPAPTTPLGRRFETGTQPYELLAGFSAAIDYLDSIGRFEAIVPYERALGQRFVETISDAVTIYGLPEHGGPRADVPRQRRWRSRAGCRRRPRGRADRCVGPRFVVFARALQAARVYRRGRPHRIHSLQHARRGRPTRGRPRGDARIVPHRRFPVPLHPQARQLIDTLEAAGLPTLPELSPPAAREQATLLNEIVGPGPEVAIVEDFTIPVTGASIAARLYEPTDIAATIVYIHGGGWTICDLDSHDAMCRVLANSSGCRVVAIDYRLAPEHPFPTPLEDSWDALCWVASKYPNEPLVIGGDSAGGNMTAVCALRARDRGGPAARAPGARVSRDRLHDA